MVPDMGRKDGYSTALCQTIVTGELKCISPSQITLSYVTYPKREKVDRYIINEGATIIFWNDGSKTISKRDKKDKFDKELGFLFAYFYGKYKGSKASMKRVLDTIDYKKIKTFLFEFYVNHSDKDYVQARNYLKNLKVANK